MPERARTDLWEPQGSNPLGPPGPELHKAAVIRHQIVTTILPICWFDSR